MGRSARRSRYSGESELGIWLLGALLFVLVAAAVGGLSYLRWIANERPQLDALSLCPVDSGPRSTTVVLLDTSDPWPDIVRAAVNKHLEKEVEKVAEYGLLELRLLDLASAGGRVLFSKCNPGDGSNLSEITANPRMAKKQWQDQFMTPLAAAFDTAKVQSKTPTSPILETIQRIAIDHLRDGYPAKLVIVSDMIEYTPEYSQYGARDLTYDEYRRSPGFKRRRTDLHQAHVTILYIERIRSNSRQHIQFWADWVEDSHGVWDDAIRIDGAQ